MRPSCSAGGGVSTRPLAPAPPRGLGAAGVQLDAQEAPGVPRDEAIPGPALGAVDEHEALGVLLLAEVDALDAAGIEHQGMGVQHLVPVDMAEGDVDKGRM